jgi:hypothetical protein
VFCDKTLEYIWWRRRREDKTSCLEGLAGEIFGCCSSLVELGLSCFS